MRKTVSSHYFILRTVELPAADFKHLPQLEVKAHKGRNNLCFGRLVQYIDRQRNQEERFELRFRVRASCVNQDVFRASQCLLELRKELLQLRFEEADQLAVA